MFIFILTWKQTNTAGKELAPLSKWGGGGGGWVQIGTRNLQELIFRQLQQVVNKFRVKL